MALYVQTKCFCFNHPSRERYYFCIFNMFQLDFSSKTVKKEMDIMFVFIHEVQPCDHRGCYVATQNSWTQHANSKTQRQHWSCLSLDFIAVEVYLVFTKPEQIASVHGEWERWEFHLLASHQHRHAASVKGAVCSFTLIHSQCRRCYISSSCTWDFTSMSKMQEASLCSSRLLQIPFWMIKNKCYYAVYKLIVLQFWFCVSKLHSWQKQGNHRELKC